MAQFTFAEYPGRNCYLKMKMIASCYHDRPDKLIMISNGFNVCHFPQRSTESATEFITQLHVKGIFLVM